jgi:uncharacterized repeat protein (TIGR03803 family)
VLSNRAMFRSALLGSALALLAFAPTAWAKPGYRVLHNFVGAPGDGAYPLVGVTFDDAGDMYGVSYVGGAYNLGTLLKIAPDGTETIVRSFGKGNDGAFPRSQPTIEQSTGNVYGTTNGGGGSINCDGGCGTIWGYAAGGTYKVLHKFDFTDGSQPVGQLLRDATGNLYGITTNGGANNEGEVFEYTAGGKFKVLHTFAGTDGAYPECSLVQDRAGNIYGTTEGGGNGNDGTVFKIQSDGRFTTLYRFTAGSDGANPVGGLDRKSGNLYGTTENGGANGVGTVFRLAANGTLTTLYAFVGGTDGANPQGDILRVNSTLYGATSSGGDANGYGVIYKVDMASGIETVLHRFTGTDGSTSVSKLAKKHGKLYGTAAYGGADGDGVVFSLNTK